MFISIWKGIILLIRLKKKRSIVRPTDYLDIKTFEKCILNFINPMENRLGNIKFGWFFISASDFIRFSFFLLLNYLWKYWIFICKILFPKFEIFCFFLFIFFLELNGFLIHNVCEGLDFVFKYRVLLSTRV